MEALGIASVLNRRVVMMEKSDMQSSDVIFCFDLRLRPDGLRCFERIHVNITMARC